MQTVPPEKRPETGYSVLRVKKETKAQLDQIMREANTQTENDVISLLIECYNASKTADQQKS